MDPFTEYLQKNGEKDPFTEYLETEKPKKFSREDLGKLSPEVIKQIAKESPVGKIVGRTFGEAVPAFGKGVVGGATLGAVDIPTDESSRLPRYSHTAGEFVGGAAPVAAAGTVAGAMLPAAAPAAVAALTGGIYAGASGAVQGQDPLTTGEEILTSAATFPAMRKVGDALGYLRQVFGEKIGPRLGNWFFGTIPRVAQDRAKAGKPDVFSDALKKTDIFDEGIFGGFVSREKAQLRAETELSRLQNQSRFFSSSPATVSRGELISKEELGPINNLQKVAHDLLRSYSRRPYDPEKIAILHKVKNIADHGETLPLKDWIRFKDLLDDELSPLEHIQPYGPLRHEAASIRTIADNLRAKIAEKYPELSENLSKQSLLLNILDGIRPLTSMDKNMPSANAQNWIGAAAKFATGNRVGAGMATALTRGLEKPLPQAVSRAVELGARQAVPDRETISRLLGRQ